MQPTCGIIDGTAACYQHATVPDHTHANGGRARIADVECTGYVYVITNTVNTKQYVGQTTRTVAKRWETHRCDASRRFRASCRALYGAMRKYGYGVFRVETLAVARSQDELNDLEADFIARLKTLVPYGYNLKDGGGARGRPHEETRAKIARANTGKKRSMEARRNIAEGCRGRKATPETKAILSRAHMGKPHVHRSHKWTPESRAKFVATMAGRRLSPEHRAKLSAANRGQKRSLEARARMAAGNRGRVPWNKGKAMSVLARANMSEAAKRWRRARSHAGQMSLLE